VGEVAFGSFPLTIEQKLGLESVVKDLKMNGLWPARETNYRDRTDAQPDRLAEMEIEYRVSQHYYRPSFNDLNLNGYSNLSSGNGAYKNELRKQGGWRFSKQDVPFKLGKNTEEFDAKHMTLDVTNNSERAFPFTAGWSYVRGQGRNAAAYSNSREKASAEPLTLTTAPAFVRASALYPSRLSAQMWAEINSVRKDFGDPNDCKKRIEEIPRSGMRIYPCDGDCINEALSKSKVVILNPGTYVLKYTVTLRDGHTLIGLPQGRVVFDASNVEVGVRLGNKTTIANVEVTNSRNFSVIVNGKESLVYRVKSYRPGYYWAKSVAGVGFAITGGRNNCIVSNDAYEGYNQDGPGCKPCCKGGNADGFQLNRGAANNSVIDCRSYRNSDDGFDTWDGLTSFFYFSLAGENGRIPGKSSGDGNGFKLGRGSAVHYLYKNESYNNMAGGFDLNGNKKAPVLVKCIASGNGLKDFLNVGNR